MGTLKQEIYRLSEVVKDLINNQGIELEELDDYLLDFVVDEYSEYEFYIKNKKTILDMAMNDINSYEDDEEWIDPVGGTHYGYEEDPASMYESIDDDIIMTTIYESRFQRSESHPLDDLKANFRSWESEDNANEESANELLNTLISRHPDYDIDKLTELAYHWVGYDPYNDIDEGCGCGGTKRPKPKNIKRPGGIRTRLY
jgi:hypothetical protein